MRIVRKDIVRNGAGSVKMVPEESDDLWHTYNLIAPGDSVLALTIRKIQREVNGMVRDPERVALKLEVQVEEVDYDKDADVLRIHGKNILENEHVKIGAYHTMELELKRRFVLRKKNWDSLAIDTLKKSSNSSASGDLGLVLIGEGHAEIFLVGSSVSRRVSQIKTSIPNLKRGGGGSGYESALKKFFEIVVHAFLRNVDFSVVRCVVIASTGFTKDQFHRHLLLEAERKQLRTIIENKSRIVLVPTSSGYSHSLKEVMQNPNVMNMIKDTKAAREVKALSDFLVMFEKDPDRACYGPKHVEVAHERMAIQTLLITDELFRCCDVKTRKKYVDFVESVKNSGGEVFIFSSMHVSGEQLANLSGIAALLRFPLPDLDDVEM